MDFKHRILQWNCRGLKSNFNEILLLLSLLRPSVLCLQETFLKPDDSINFKGFNIYNYIHQDCVRPSGGSSILIQSSCPQRQLQLTTDLQAVAVSVTLDKEVSICSVYIPPNFTLQAKQLDDLLSQLPSPYMLLGDFNGHNFLWGCSENNQRGKLIEEFIGKNDICLMNDTSSTYIHPATGNFSSLDLSLCHPSLLLDFEWSVCDDQHGSDHFPVLIESVNTSEEDHNLKWKLNKANWELFDSLCTQNLSIENFDKSLDVAADFTSSLIEISDKCIPKTSTIKSKSRPWYNDDCKEAIRQRKQALSKFCKSPTKEKLNDIKVFRAKARRTIKASKRKSWQTYVSKLNHRTPVKKVWDMIRKISGKSKSPNYSHLNTNGEDMATTKEDIANTLGGTFMINSSAKHYSKKFQDIKKQQEKTKLNFKSKNEEIYNNPFSISELKEAISKSHDTATGPDNVHYQMLKHLPENSLSTLLQIFNDIWETGNFPESWRLATIIPIPKPGKDHTEPSNYRPIALTSCLCKTLERMINTRLVWYLESNDLITDFQSGFRSERSTNDNLVRLETYIRDAFIRREHVVAIFFDLEKAYDTTWRYGILKDLHELGLKGRLPSFIQSFLHDRTIQVRVGSTLSDRYDQEQGVPQGSILSTTLFNIKINNIVKCLDQRTDCSLYVDDFCICYRSKNMRTIERHLQQCLNKIEDWATSNGFKFSKSKTQCVHFCQQRKMHTDPLIYLYGSQIPVVTEAKFLGVIFDQKLNFISHIQYLKAKCLKALNLLKVLSHTNWGADRTTLLQLYRSLIRSKLDYGSVVYGSARKSYLEELDTIHHQGLRIALGAFRTSPVKSLYVEADEPSLALRRDKLSLQYAIRLAANPSNPASKVTFPPQFSELYENKPKAIKSFGLRIAPLLESSNIYPNNIQRNSVAEIPSWCMKKPTVLFDLQKDKKSDSNPHLLKENFHELQSRYSEYQQIYTDGSKDGDKVGCAFTSGRHYKNIRLPDGASIFTAEAKAIDLALEYIENSTSNSKFIIFSDSLSVLQALNHSSSKNPQIQSLLEKHHEISDLKQILFCWLPSHVGIYGNEIADRKAKESLHLNMSDFRIPFNNFKPLINKYILSEWQTSWNSEVGNKLHEIKPLVGKGSLSTCQRFRRDDIVLTRLRIGHTRLTHSYLLKGDPQPKCIGCDKNFTVKHFLLECVDFSIVRNQLIRVGDMKQLFENVPVDNILLFLKRIQLYNKI
ncbi:MAG: reverse transcriptase domain-containing protein [Candidatus Thiodiazotropha sp.]